MEALKFNISRLKQEPCGCNCHSRYSHPTFTLKIPKGIIPLDYDKNNKLIEVQYSTGETGWHKLSTFFGKTVTDAKDILIYSSDEDYESASIVAIDVFRIKRTLYWKLIFQRDLPF